MQIFITRLDSQPLDPALLSFVSEERRRRIERLGQEQDKKRSMAAELTLRYAVWRVLRSAPDQVDVTHDRYGKPLVRQGGLTCSLSHAGIYVVAALDARSVGVDIERAAQIPRGVAQRFFASAEAAWIEQGATPQEQRDRFYTIWTCKESYVKALGQGMRIPFSSFTVSPTGPGQAECPPYRFFTCRVKGGYLLSLCTQSSGMVPVQEINEKKLLRFFRERRWEQKEEV